MKGATADGYGHVRTAYGNVGYGGSGAGRLDAPSSNPNVAPTGPLSMEQKRTNLGIGTAATDGPDDTTQLGQKLNNDGSPSMLTTMGSMWRAHEGVPGPQSVRGGLPQGQSAQE